MKEAPEDPTFYGLYRGVVVDNSDPESRLRLRVRVPGVTGRAVTGWAWPCVAPGWSQGLLVAHDDHYDDADDQTYAHDAHALRALTPAPGEGVWIMYEGGNPEHPVWMGVFGAQVVAT